MSTIILILLILRTTRILPTILWHALRRRLSQIVGDSVGGLVSDRPPTRTDGSSESATRRNSSNATRACICPRA
jgi:hypothetical protein